MKISSAKLPPLLSIFCAYIHIFLVNIPFLFLHCFAKSKIEKGINERVVGRGGEQREEKVVVAAKKTRVFGSKCQIFFRL